MKKALCAMSVLVLLTIACVPALAISIRGVNSGMTLYVNTKNASLNVHATPSQKGKITYTLPKNCPVIAQDEYSDGFLLVEFKYNGRFDTGWVSIDYLTATVPSKINNEGAKKVGSKTSAPKPTQTPQSGELVSQLNFKSYTLVAEGMKLIIASKPSRVGGWVNLRWAPSTNAAIIDKMYADELMEVITEGKDWYQVKNDAGYVGFISKQFTYVVEYSPIDIGDGVAVN